MKETIFFQEKIIMTKTPRLVDDVPPLRNYPPITDEFHTVNDLIPEGQVVLKIHPDMLVIEALDAMRANHFSQLPVIAGGQLLGVFSYQSFAEQYRILCSDENKPDLDQMIVREFIEKPHYVQVTDQLEEVITLLNENNYLLVGQKERLIGIITVADFARFTYRYATILMLFGEIELTLRKIIQSCVNEQELRNLSQIALSYVPAKRMPHTLQDMVFNHYIDLISHEECYPQFAKVFGQGEWHRNRTRSKLNEIRLLRNDSFHFKREIVSQDINNLLGYRDWIKTIAEAYAGQNQGE